MKCGCAAVCNMLTVVSVMMTTGRVRPIAAVGDSQPQWGGSYHRAIKACQ
jgi:hypothetical protein